MGVVGRMSQLAGLGDIVDGIVGGLGNFINRIIDGYLALFANWFYTIFLAFATLLDLIQALFRKLAGLEYYVVNGQETTQTRDIALELLSNQAVMNIFWSLVILGVVLLFISTFIAVIKSEYQPLETKGSNSKGKIIGKALKSVLLMATVPVVSILGLFVGNALLNSLDQATSGTQNAKLSGRIFEAAAYEANRSREGLGCFDEDFLDNLANENNFGLFIESNSGFIVETVADKIDAAFANNTEVLNGNYEYDFSISINPVLDWVYGKIGRPNYPESFSIYSYRLVWFYYDLTNFNFFIAIGVSIMLITILLMTMLGLIKRLYAIVMLFVLAPPIIAISPINEDAYNKKWKPEFISNVLSAYSTIVVMNLYIMLIPVFAQIEFFQIDSTMSNAQQIANQVGNLVSQLFILIGGAVFFKDFSKTLAGMVGAGDALGEGAGKSKEFMQATAKAASIASGLGATKVFTTPFKSGVKAINNGIKTGRDIYQGKKNGMTGWAAISNAVSNRKKEAWDGVKGKVSGLKNKAISEWADMRDKGFSGYVKNKFDDIKKYNPMFNELTNSAFKDGMSARAKLAKGKQEKDRAINQHKEQVKAMMMTEGEKQAAKEERENPNKAVNKQSAAQELQQAEFDSLRQLKTSQYNKAIEDKGGYNDQITALEAEIASIRSGNTAATPEELTKKKAELDSIQEQKKVALAKMKEEEKKIEDLKKVMNQTGASYDQIIAGEKINFKQFKAKEQDLKNTAQEMKTMIEKIKPTV